MDELGSMKKEPRKALLKKIVAMAVLATYLLFAQFNIWLIKMLKKNRSFYFKKTNLLWISNLFYKIKDNSRMFFLISITSAVTFTSIGTCLAFWKNNLDSIENRYHYDFVYSTLGKPEIAPEQTGFLEDLLKEEMYTYKKVILKTVSYEADSEDFTP